MLTRCKNVAKIGNFSQLVSVSQKRCKIGPYSQWPTNRRSYTCFRLVPKSSTLDDPERPWTAKTHSRVEKMRLLEPTAQIYKGRPMSLVSGNITYMRILAGVPLFGDLKWVWGCCRRQFLAIWVATSSETLGIRPAILYDDMLLFVGLWLIAKWMT